ncbi:MULTISPECIES: MFS transporter [unclassified Mesorhizobium]|uniref:MFS transporter n=1 Tax=unclassified Mesorhizobium TaxID=325217 RepID=UPI000BB0034B|nr:MULTISPECIES: MFS transporter [unclassified Mesorhizobium]TGT59409.1 MFS transporter [Mesorhizobium sp. M00.F.Ca.ET.170.01.1.1]AZO12416.1 MFS transporter [Mesorhizobium sp. M3A.F.Ca.ET.080.04.2.1]PBB85916.1 MFS transporter [Mesorhizobium sp. WSM3876]RWB69416.1 MAG: MFS transporter [Mesorhizobium sp.]RWB85807.1 MAG: MFS transporter [Mesorhizobium sp.]
MALAHPKTGEAVQWAAIIGVIATVSVFAIAQGLSYPLLSFILQRQGVSPAMIGLSAAMTPIGFILSSPPIPALARRFGAGRLALACAALSALMLALVGWTQNVYLWFPLRFLVGVVTNPLYVLSETWVIALAPPSRRGRVMGAYSTVISTGFAAGPLCLLAVGTEGWPPFLVGICAFLFCGLCLALVVGRLPKIDEPENEASVLGFMPKAWLLLSAVVVAAGFEQAVLALLPVYGTHYGIVESHMSALLSTMIAGNIFMQVPLGLLAERLTARLVRLGCVSATILGCILLPELVDTRLIWVCVFVWGAASYGIYTMSIIELGERFSGSALVAGNAAFSLMWGVGGFLVPPLTGSVMEVIGASGLPVTLGAICAVLAAATIIHRRVM